MRVRDRDLWIVGGLWLALSVAGECACTLARLPAGNACDHADNRSSTV